MAQRPHDPYSPHDAVDDEPAPAKRGARKATPKPNDVQSTAAKTLPVKAPAKKTAAKKRAAKKTSARGKKR